MPSSTTPNTAARISDSPHKATKTPPDKIAEAANDLQPDNTIIDISESGPPGQSIDPGDGVIDISESFNNHHEADMLQGQQPPQSLENQQQRKSPEEEARQLDTLEASRALEDDTSKEAPGSRAGDLEQVWL